MTDSVKKVFLTGATGYIGGEVLYQLSQDEQYSFQITALVRSKAKAEKLSSFQATPLIGSLDDVDLIKKQVLDSDIVIHTASADDEVSAKALKEALVFKKSPTILIHTSGTNVLQDELLPGRGPTDKVYGDISDNKEIIEFDDSRPHRIVDKIIFSIQEENPQFVRTVTIAPPNIFGFARGPDHKISIQVPALIRLALKHKRAVSVYSGRYLWNQVHVRDLGKLYILLLHKLIESPESVAIGKKGYYFAENGSPLTWREKSEKIGEILKGKGLVETAEVSEMTPKQIIDLSGGVSFTPYLVGTNSRCKAELARKLGWKPTQSSDSDFWSDLAQLVDYVLENE